MIDYRNDIERLKALLSYEIMDTPAEENFDNLAKLVSIICNTPAAIISFIDDKKQWYKAKLGTRDNEVPYEETICQYVISDQNLLEITNTLEDERLINNPHVHKENGVRFYIGVPLISDNGHTIGTVCTFDGVTKKLTDDQKNALKIIANQVMHILDVSKKNKVLSEEVKNILEQKIDEAKRDIETTEAAYNTLFKAINESNAVIEFSPEGIIEYVNDEFLDIMGYSKNELIGQNHNILLNNEDLDLNIDFWKKLNTGKFQSGRFKRKHKNGSLVWIQASYSPVLNADKEIVKITKIAQNITIEINAQEALEKAKLLADELNIQKDHFIANISHEIRTPINAVLGFTDLLLEEETNEKKTNYLKSVKTAGDNLLYLINDILDLSKIETGIFQIDQSPFNLYKTIDDVFSILGLKAKQKELVFNKIIDQKVPKYVIGDKNRLTQILVNLIGNAIKFTSIGNVSLVVSLHENARLKFEVSDTGIGIPQDKLKSIFERFSQAQENTSRQYGGSGLGLNISKLLVEKLGGELEVKSELGNGSTFTFYLPFMACQEEKFNESLTESSIITKNNSVSILMCEDNEMNQKLITEIFSKTNHKVSIANNGNEGIDLLSKNNYDLILMDIQMPILDGYQTTTIIREELKLEIPIIALTAHSTIKEREKCFSLGMNDYISKPFKKNELLHKIEVLTKPDSLKKIITEKSISKNSSDIISLEYLKEMSSNDLDFQNEMLTLFMNQSIENKKLLEEYINEEKYSQVKKIAHKLKSSFSLIGANLETLEFFENLEPENRKHIKTYLTKLDEQISLIHIEIDKILKKN